MSYANGLIPLAALGRTKTGHRLRADAAASYDRMEAAFRRDLGYTLAITDAYRDLMAQHAVKAAKGFLAATPGKSEHGWGLALDLASGVPDARSAAHRWMDAHAAQYGWVNPLWAQTWKFEPWHWEYVAHLDKHTGGTHAARPKGFLMALNDAQQEQLRLDVTNIAAWLFGGGAGVDRGEFANGTIAQRVVNIDRQLTGAQGNSINAVDALGVILERLAPVNRGEAVSLRQEIADTKTATLDIQAALTSALPALLGASGAVVDEDALASALAPMLLAAIPRLSDEDLERQAKANADEQARRLTNGAS